MSRCWRCPPWRAGACVCWPITRSCSWCATSATIEGKIGDTVSLLPLSAEARGVTTHGLLYPLEAATLRYEQARGVSNVLIEPPGRVELSAGLLLVVHHDDGGAHQFYAGQAPIKA